MKKTEGVFTVVVGDLISSRRISARQRTSTRIRRAVRLANSKFRKEFHAPMLLTRGMDELSGVLSNCAMSYRICRFLNSEIHPNQFRFAIVRGILDVAISSRDAGMMDGPAFHRSASLIERAKRAHLYYQFSLGKTQRGVDAVLNTIPDLLQVLKADWTERRFQIVRLYERMRNQKSVAKKLGITQQGVSDALVQAHWREISLAEDMLDGILRDLATESRVSR